MSSTKNTEIIDSNEIDELETVEAEVIEKAESQLPALASSKVPATSDPLGQYLSEIGKYRLLNPEEEKALAIRLYEHEDQEAAEQLVKANLRFVVKIASEYAQYGSKLIDLVQEGNIGLMQAVREFNPYKGVRLITYAVWWIRGYIREYLMRNHSIVRIGTNNKQKKLYYQLKKEEEKLKSLGKEVSVPLLSQRLDVDEKDIVQMQQRLKKPDLSLDQELDSESRNTFLDLQSDAEQIPIDEDMATKEMLNLLKDKIANIEPNLNEKEKYILKNRILADEPQTLQEIGDYYGISRERARQLEARIIKKIKLEFSE